MPTTHYVWNPVDDTVLMEKDGDGNTTATYTHMPGLHGELISQRRNGQTSHYHYDGIGNTVALTDENENVTDTYKYTAFGETVAKTGSTTNPFGFKGALGYYANPETDDFYVRARTYDPAISRWLSADPIGFVNGPNLYAYVLNDPVNLVDPSGLACKVCGWHFYMDEGTKFSEIDGAFKPDQHPFNAAVIARYHSPSYLGRPGLREQYGLPTPWNWFVVGWAMAAGRFYNYQTGSRVAKHPTEPIELHTYLFAVAADVCEGDPGDCEVKLAETGTGFRRLRLDAPWGEPRPLRFADVVVNPIPTWESVFVSTWAGDPVPTIVIGDLKEPVGECSKRILIVDSPIIQQRTGMSRFIRSAQYIRQVIKANVTIKDTTAADPLLDVAGFAQYEFTQGVTDDGRPEFIPRVNNTVP